MQSRDRGQLTSAVGIVEMIRCPVSAARIAVSSVSGSHSSLMTTTSGSCRSAACRPTAEAVGVHAHFRWVTEHFTSRWRNSIGFSIVRM